MTFLVPFGGIFEEPKLATSFSIIEVVFMCLYDAWETLRTDFESLHVDLKPKYHMLVDFLSEIFTIDWMFVRTHSCSTLHDLKIMLYEEKSKMVEGISTPCLCSILCSSWIALGNRGIVGFSYLFGDLEHMRKVTYPQRLMVACITDVDIHVEVLALPHFEYTSSILRAIVHIIKAKLVECIVDIISSLKHDIFYSFRWVWDFGLCCNYLRERNLERGSFVMSLF